MVGIPKGRFSLLPGFGIHTLFTGAGFDQGLTKLLTRISLSLGVRDFKPSMPAVFLPVLSWVTFLTARHLADQEFSSNLCNLRTLFASPCFEAQ